MRFSFLAKRPFSNTVNQNRFLTNKHYKKYCLVCEKPNIIPRSLCTFCESPIDHSTVKYLARDPIVESLLLQPTNYKGNVIETKLPPGFRLKIRPTCESNQTLEGVRKQFKILKKTSQLLVLSNPFKCGFAHILGIPKYLIYDIKQLRPSHAPLLRKLQTLMLSVLTTQMSQDTANPKTSSVYAKLIENTIFGINYPSEYNQLTVHAVVPPIVNHETFKSPYFYSLDYIVEQLEAKRAVCTFPREATEHYNSPLVEKFEAYIRVQNEKGSNVMKKMT